MLRAGHGLADGLLTRYKNPSGHCPAFPKDPLPIVDASIREEVSDGV
jgi:hypothetical protein